MLPLDKLSQAIKVQRELIQLFRNNNQVHVKLNYEISLSSSTKALTFYFSRKVTFPDSKMQPNILYMFSVILQLNDKNSTNRR